MEKMTKKILQLATGFGGAVMAMAIAAAPATAAPAVTVKGANDNTITARAHSVQPNSVCTMNDISTGKSISGTTAADGTVTLVLTKMRRGPHAVDVTCTGPDGVRQLLADHRSAPITA